MLRRLTLVAAAVGVAALIAGPALAATEISINPGNVANGGVLAKDVDQGCDFGGGPIDGKDVWVFVLPGKHNTSGDFVSVTAFFDSDGNGTPDQKVHIDADGGGFVDGGPSTAKAYIALPAGWRLLSATAVITGTADSFNLTHTCQASTHPHPSYSPKPSSSPSMSASPSASASPSMSASPSESASASPSESASASASPSGSASGSPSTAPSASPSSGGGLPITGTSVAGLAVSAVVLIVAGTFAVLVSRRRRFSAPEEEV